MKNIGVIFRRDFNDLTGGKAFKWLLLSFGLLAVLNSLLFGLIFLGISQVGPIFSREDIEVMLGSSIYFFSLLPFLAFIWIYTPPILTKEKSNGSLETLLATPLAPSELWIGKGLAIFLPGFLTSLGAAALMLVAINLSSIAIDYEGGFFFPSAIFITSIGSNSILFLLLTFFVVIISFYKNPDIAILPSFVIGFGLLIGIPLGIVLNFIDIMSWDFTWYNLLATACFCFLVMGMSLLLSKEKIVLSSKGQ